MKRIKNCILVLLGAVMTSCNALDLGPEDFYSINNYWNSAEQCERFMIGDCTTGCASVPRRCG